MIKLKWTEKIGFAIISICVGLGLYYSNTDVAFFEQVYVREDSFIEWLTVGALFLGAFACFYRINILRPFRRRRFLLGLLLMGLLFVFGIGEEISWGQRIFDFKSPAFFMKYNTQMETNLHNLKFGGTKLNKLVFGLMLGAIIGIYFLILPILYRKVEKVQKFVDSVALPIPKTFHIVAYLLLALCVKFIPTPKKGEILEFGGCWIFFMMILEPYNRKLFGRNSIER